MTTKIIIGLAGPEGVGKSTVANAIVERMAHMTNFKAVAYKASFATPLYEALSTMFNVSIEHIREHKDELFTIKTAPVPCLFGFSFRYLLQRLGTEFGRAQISPNFWAQMAIKREDKVWAGKVNLIVFDDVRFAEEANQCDKVYELFREGITYAKNHPSNAGLPGDINRMIIHLNQSPVEAAQQIIRNVIDRMNVAVG